MAGDARILIVPGWRDSGPGHWRNWGSEIVRVPDAGHINVDSGHGEWPLGVALLQSLLAPHDLSHNLKLYKKHETVL